MKPEFILPDWPAPSNVRALSTTRAGGVSPAPWNSLNLGDHVEDDHAGVAQNRRILRQAAGLPAEPMWLEQVHGCDVRTGEQPRTQADASFSRHPGEVCAVLTADCLPVLFCTLDGSAVAAAHAGWRGLAAGVLEQTLDCFSRTPSSIMAWMGPAIGSGAFEVGDEVRQAFIRPLPQTAGAFVPAGSGKWLMDIFLVARLRLEQAGVVQIYGGGHCTFTEAGHFFSYRRDGRTGRMASLIWLED
jgi:YfiH family protein